MLSLITETVGSRESLNMDKNTVGKTVDNISLSRQNMRKLKFLNNTQVCAFVYTQPLP